MFVRLLLDRGVGAAGVAIDSGPVKGVLRLPLSSLRTARPVLGNPFNLRKARAAHAEAVPLRLHQQPDGRRVAEGLRPVSHPGRRTRAVPRRLRQLQPQSGDEGRPCEA
ncbi:hypothetical protein BS329_33470 [Amycolatopsis coloradensis]|uniref:Uncharacterized protein n=1 Tax=Amycolatopsis coloradensis TaxID=76021 RepID=A0A1R0KHX3_9PSEU|nr:hypothetical protein BS329_33470 [Amycolatopsis coloradensis]